MFVSCRGPIDKVDNILPATVAASLVLSEDRKAIIWTIGRCNDLHRSLLEKSLRIASTQGRGFPLKAWKCHCRPLCIFPITQSSLMMMTLSALDSMPI